jgi:hypothetical protein
LSRREVTRGKSGEIGQADHLKPSLDDGGFVNGAGTIEKSRPERKIFRYRQGWLEGIDVPDVMGLLPDAQFRVTAFKGDVSFGGMNEACDEAQQRTLAGPVRPGQDQRATGRKRKADSVEHPATAADAGQIMAR